MITLIEQYLLDLQQRICHFIEYEDGQGKFIEDQWEHQEGGGGVTRIITSGSVIEKAGVNFSHVHGLQLPHAATMRRPELVAHTGFEALGVSVVIHPLNPYIPTAHFNVRFILVKKEGADSIWWFGGGFDLTPYYGFTEDCIHWHQMAKNACDPFGPNVYLTYKKWADQYFFLKHRNEPRGIGGIFYDDLYAWGFEHCFSFMKSVGDHFIKAYQPIVARRKQCLYGQKERDFQAYRRGRYVEFNLLHDRGTLFGLQSSGRTESILMSLPPLVTWHYDWKPQPNTAEAKLYDEYLRTKEWL